MHSTHTTFAGIDWATRSHAVCVIDEHRHRRIERFEVEHDRGGSRQDLVARGSLPRRGQRSRHRAPRRPGHRRPARQRDCGSWSSPAATSRHCAAATAVPATRTTAADAYILADVLRTDGHRLRPLLPDSPATMALRASVRARKDLVQTRVGLVQQLSAHLAHRVPRRPGALQQARVTHRGGLPDALPLARPRQPG